MFKNKSFGLLRDMVIYSTLYYSPSVGRSVWLSIIYLPTYLSICLSVYLPTYLATFLRVSVQIYISHVCTQTEYIKR